MEASFGPALAGRSGAVAVHTHPSCEGSGVFISIGYLRLSWPCLALPFLVDHGPRTLWKRGFLLGRAMDWAPGGPCGGPSCPHITSSSSPCLPCLSFLLRRVEHVSDVECHDGFSSDSLQWLRACGYSSSSECRST